LLIFPYTTLFRSISGFLELSLIYCQRASLGTQKIFSAKYSSLSSSSAYSSFNNSSYFSSKESDTYFKNIIPNATFLYSAASILPRNLSAACHNFSSNPIVAINNSSCLFQYIKNCRDIIRNIVIFRTYLLFKLIYLYVNNSVLTLLSTCIGTLAR